MVKKIIPTLANKLIFVGGRESQREFLYLTLDFKYMV